MKGVVAGGEGGPTAVEPPAGRDAGPGAGPNHDDQADGADLAARVELLAGTPVLYKLPARVLRRLARRMERMAVSPGATLVDVGEQNDRILFIGEGMCESSIVASGAPWVTRLRPGDWFGLESAILEARQPAAVIAAEPATIYSLGATAARAILEDVPGAIEELEQLAAQVLEKQRQIQLRATSTILPRHDAVVIPVYSASGGSGRTTVAINLCAALAVEAPGRVLLIDLALPYAQACLMSNLIPTGSLATAARTGGVPGEEALLAAALYHPSGMMVLPGAVRVEEAELVSAEVVAAALAVLAGKFSYIVVDLALPLDEVAVTVFDKAQQAVLVVTPDLASIRGATEAMRVLDEAFGIPPQLVSIVLNQRTAKPGTSREAVVAALDRVPDVEIRYDDSRPARAGLHGTLSFDDPRSTFRPAMQELVARIDSLCVAPQTRAGTVSGTPSS